MSVNKKVSVIIPCYNVELYIHECLESILTQTIGLDMLEIIIVDDASKDSTLSILKQYEMQYCSQIILIPLSQNQGQGFARNLALSYAAGDYIMYVDADDFLAPYAIELLIQKMQQSQCDMIEYDFQRNFEHWPPISEPQNTPLQLFAADSAVKQQLLLTSISKYALACNKIYRRSFLTEHEIFYAEHLRFEDTLFTELSLLYVRKYGYYPVSLYYYRINTAGTTLETNGGQKEFDRLLVQLLFLEECKKRALFSSFFLGIEAIFIRTYYIDTMIPVLKQFTKAPLDKIAEMQTTVKTLFPNYRENPFLYYQQFPMEQYLLSTLSIPFTEAAFQQAKTDLSHYLSTP